MGRKIKLIWDFRGSVASKTAEHHEKHLKEYIAIEAVASDSTGFQDLSDTHSIAYMVIEEKDMKPLRDALKPHRGEVWSPPETTKNS